MYVILYRDGSRGTSREIWFAMTALQFSRAAADRWCDQNHVPGRVYKVRFVDTGYLSGDD